jgi:class 3 adenylate cyclase/tetratricopeptide (TPR) repeat protein
VREAERRQLTVMFCDLVDSTELSARLDPEDWREVVRRFQQACADVVQRYEGHVAQYLGDGLLIYFGYPLAHEDDPERAARAGLGVMLTLAELNPLLEKQHGIELAARIGIHTGTVVVGEMGSGDRRETLALGEGANVAARLQGIAEAGSVVVSQATLRLVPGIFVTRELGPRLLKGVAEPVGIHQILQASGVRSRLDGAAAIRLTPFVGRDLEIGLLLERWEQVLEGEGQSVLVSGEAGIGKSRLILALRERLTGDAHTWLECRASPYTVGSAFHPMVELLERGLAFGPQDAPADKLDKLENGVELARLDSPHTVRVLADLLDLPAEGDDAAVSMTPQMRREETIDGLTAWTLALGEDQPVVLLAEDLQWADPSSLELLGRLVDQIPTSRVLMLLTARPSFVVPWSHPKNWTTVAINRLRVRQARELVAARADPVRLPPMALEQIVKRADGIPLYLEELTGAALEAEAGGPSAAIPSTLQDSLMARLDRLGSAREVAQLASVVGRESSFRLLASAADLEPVVLRESLAQLVTSDLLLQRATPPEASYTFRHSLLQEVAYGSMLREKRRALHGRVARALEQDFPERATSEPEVLARHYDEAQMPLDAIRCYKHAGDRSAATSATQEAVSHLTRGLELVASLDPADREREELALQLLLGPVLVAVKGAGDDATGRAYARARALCHEGAPELLHILPGLFNFHLNRGEMQSAFEIAEEQLGMARGAADPAHLMRAHWSLGQALYVRGDPPKSVHHFEQALRVFRPSRDRVLSHDRSDQGVSLRSWQAWASWLSGRPDQALACAEQAVDLARSGGHAYSLAYALGFNAVLQVMRRDPKRCRERAQEAIVVSQDRGFPLYRTVGELAALWADAADALDGRDNGDTIERYRRGLGSLTGMGNQFGQPLVLATLAQLLHDAQRAPEALATIQSALEFAGRTGIRYWDADLLRMQGETLLLGEAASARDPAERLFLQAREMAKTQGARSLELRAVTSLAGLWHREGRNSEARAVLVGVHDWFTEGLDTPDLKDAGDLLERLQ